MGKESTRMCIRCALERIYISNCLRHEIIPISKLDPAKLDFQCYKRHLHDISPQREKNPRHPLCCLCGEPAFYQCRALQKFDIYRRPIGLQLQRGCNLRVCTSCKLAVNQYGMCQTRIEEAIKERRGMHPRADIEFLFPGSDLHKAWER